MGSFNGAVCGMGRVALIAVYVGVGDVMGLGVGIGVVREGVVGFGFNVCETGSNFNLFLLTIVWEESLLTLGLLGVLWVLPLLTETWVRL